MEPIRALPVRLGEDSRSPEEAQAGAEQDGSQSAGRFPGAVSRPHEPPDSEAYGETVQDDSQREKIPAGVCTVGVRAEDGAVRRRVQTESQQAQNQGRQVNANRPLGKEPLGQAGSQYPCQTEENGFPVASDEDRQQDAQEQHAGQGHEDEPIQEDQHPPVGSRQMADERSQAETQQTGQQQLTFAGTQISHPTRGYDRCSTLVLSSGMWIISGWGGDRIPTGPGPISGFLRQDRKRRDRNPIRKPERCWNRGT